MLLGRSLALIAVLSCFFTLTHAVISTEEMLQWHYAVVDCDSPTTEAWMIPSKTNTCLKVFISIRSQDYGSISDNSGELTRYFSAGGEKPIVSSDSDAFQLTLKSSAVRTPHWLYKINVTSPGLFTGEISASMNAETRLLTRRFVVPASPFLARVEGSTKYTTPLGSVVTTQSTPPTRLRLESTAKSPVAFAFFQPPAVLSLDIAMSPTAFREWGGGGLTKVIFRPTMPWAINTTLPHPKCTTGAGTADDGVYTMVDTGQHVVMATEGGVFTITAGDGLTAARLSERCVHKILAAPAYQGRGQTVLALSPRTGGVELLVNGTDGTLGAWVAEDGSTPFATDAAFSTAVGTSLTGVTVIDVGVLDDQVIVLVESAGPRYHLTSFMLTGGPLVPLWAAPSKLDCVKGRVLASWTAADAGTPLVLSGIGLTDYPSTTVRLVGSHVLESTNALAWTCVPPVPSNDVVAFTSDPHLPLHAYITAVGTIAVSMGDHMSPGHASAFTGTANVVGALSDPNIGGTPLILAIDLTKAADPLPVMAVEQSLLQLVADTTVRTPADVCPYQQSTMAFPADPAVTRSTARFAADPTGTWFYPIRLYLDKAGSYSFTLTSTVTTLGVDASLATATIMHPDVFRIDATHTVQGDIVTQTFTLHELPSSRALAAPGTDLTSDTLTITFPVADTAHCTSGEYPLPSIAIELFSGCPPGHQLVFDEPRTSAAYDQGCTATDGVPCYYYENAFEPRFTMLDTVTGKSVDFTDPFTFELTAGAVEQPVTPFTSWERGQYDRSGNLRIWSSSSSTLTPGDAITWLCGIGSPCFNVWPRYRPWHIIDDVTAWDVLIPRSPHYFLTFRTTGVDVGTSYCLVEAEVLIRLHGLQMELFVVVLIAILGTIGLCVIMTAAFCACGRTNQKKAMAELNGMENIVGQG